MTNVEKKKLLQSIDATKVRYPMKPYYEAMEDMGDHKFNYTDYMSTAPVDCEKELVRRNSCRSFHSVVIYKG